MSVHDSVSKTCVRANQHLPDDDEDEAKGKPCPQTSSDVRHSLRKYNPEEDRPATSSHPLCEQCPQLLPGLNPVDGVDEDDKRASESSDKDLGNVA